MRTKNYTRIREGINLARRVSREAKTYGLSDKLVRMPHPVTVQAAHTYVQNRQWDGIIMHRAEGGKMLGFRVRPHIGRYF